MTENSDHELFIISIFQILPIEIFYQIINLVSDQKTFNSISRSCKSLNFICNDSVVQKNFKQKIMKKICRQVNFSSRMEYFILPNGSKEGEYKSWNSDGQLLEQSFYKEGKFNGEYKLWHENGILKKHYFF